MDQPNPPDIVITPSCFRFVNQAEPDYADNTYTITTVNELENIDENTVQSNFLKLLFIKVLYWKMAKPTENKGGYTYTTKGNKQGGSVNYDRMIVGMDIFAKKGKNVVTFLMGANDNRFFFDNEITRRDNGMLCKFFRRTRYVTIIGPKMFIFINFLSLFTFYSPRIHFRH